MTGPIVPYPYDIGTCRRFLPRGQGAVLEGHLDVQTAKCSALVWKPACTADLNMDENRFRMLLDASVVKVFEYRA